MKTTIEQLRSEYHAADEADAYAARDGQPIEEADELNRRREDAYIRLEWALYHERRKQS